MLNLNGSVAIFRGIKTLLTRRDIWRSDQGNRIWEVVKKDLCMPHVTSRIAVPRIFFIIALIDCSDYRTAGLVDPKFIYHNKKIRVCDLYSKENVSKSIMIKSNKVFSLTPLVWLNR